MIRLPFQPGYVQNPGMTCDIVESRFRYARYISTIQDNLFLEPGWSHSRKVQEHPFPMTNPGKSRRTSAARATEPAEAINRHLGSRVKNLRTARGWSLEA